MFRHTSNKILSNSYRHGGLMKIWSRQFSLPSHTKLTMPALSPTMTEGVIANWTKKVGDLVEAGEPICEIETDKATVDFEVVDDGYLAKIVVDANQPPLSVGSIIGIIVEEESDVAAFANVSASDLQEGGESSNNDNNNNNSSDSNGTKQPIEQAKPIASTPQVATQKNDGSRIFASPLAKLIARENGVSLEKITKASGPNGRILRADVEDFISSGAASATTIASSSADVVTAVEGQTMAPMSIGNAFDVPVSSDAQALAQQLEKSKREVPHYYLNVDVEIDNLLKLRDELNSSMPETDHISLNDFVVRAAALCMSRVPEANSSWGGSFIRKYKNVDINVAMINKNEDGLLMPVIRNAQNKGLGAIASESRDFISTDDEESLDLGVGTFTISNLGAYGLKTFTPIVREPQGCSLGIGTISKRAIPGPVDEEGKATIQVQTTLTATLSCDHRVIDGAVGAQWLQEFKALLKNPISMLL